MKILIADDNMDNLEMLRIILSSKNHEVHSVNNGQEALDMLHSDHFDLIISDILMPVMDGFQLCRECKKDDRLRKIYFVFYTATYIDEKDEEFAVSLGAQKFIRKPQEPEVFLKIIEEIIVSKDLIISDLEKHIETDEKEVLKLYSERLVHKLEQKNMELKEALESQRKIEQKLTESEERLAIAIDGTSDCLWDWNIIKDECYYSDRYIIFMGYGREELPKNGKAWIDLIHPDDRESALKQFDDYLARKQDHYESVFRIKTKSGSYIWIQSTGKALYDEKGTPYRFVGFHSDITGKKEQELELIKAKEKAEESDKLKSAFLTNISHEVRTPMNGIIGFMNLLRSSDLPLSKQTHYFDILEKSCNQLLNIITDIVEISRIDTKQIHAIINETNISAVIQNVYSKFLNDLKENKNVRLIQSIHKSVKDYICNTDETKLAQILTNLMTNAVKYTIKGTIELGCQINKTNELEFFVKDTGIGIPREFHELIFENFRQLDNPPSGLVEGMGLGLSISKAYVELLGGRIWLESIPDKGSTFCFTIPCNKGSEQDDPEKSSFGDHQLDLADKVFLIAEDDDNNYAYLEEILTDYKAKLYRALNGNEAIELCKSHPEIDMVLMDLKMPVMDGDSATQQILKFRKDLPVIAQTAYAFEDDRRKALESGCVDYITKPISYDHLIAVIKKYLR